MCVRSKLLLALSALMVGLLSIPLVQVGEASVDETDGILGKDCPGCAEWFNEQCEDVHVSCQCKGNVAPIANCTGEAVISTGEWESWSTQATFEEGATKRPRQSSVSCYVVWQCVNGALMDDQWCNGGGCAEQIGKQCRQCTPAANSTVTSFPDDYCKTCVP